MSKPDKYREGDEVNILTSAVVADSSWNKGPVRFLFGIKDVNGEYRPTIEQRDANTGEFIKDFTEMPTIIVTQAADIAQLKIGNYIFTPHTNALDSFKDNSLAIEYIGE